MLNLIVDENAPNLNGLVANFITGGVAALKDFTRGDESVPVEVRTVKKSNSNTHAYDDTYVSGDSIFIGIGYYPDNLALNEITTALAAASVTRTLAVAGSSTANQTYSISFTPGSYGGLYSITATVNATTEVCGNAGPLYSESELLAVLLNHSLLTTSNVSVTKDGDSFIVEFIGNLSGPATPTIAVTNVSLQAPTGLSGTFTINTDEMVAAFAATTANWLDLPFQVTRLRGGNMQTVYNGTVRVSRSVINPGSAIPIPPNTVAIITRISNLTTNGSVYTSGGNGTLGIVTNAVGVLTNDGIGGLSFAPVSGSGTVTSVSVATANGVSGTVATATTTPAITLILGAITPTTVNGITLALHDTGLSLDNILISKTGSANINNGTLNTCIGSGALLSLTDGIQNTAMGYWGQIGVTTGSFNTSMGANALRTITDGANNTAVGGSAFANTSGSGNVGLGYLAGTYQTGDNTLCIDNQDRGNSTNELLQGLIYGTFNPTPASQFIRFNVGTFTIGYANAINFKDYTLTASATGTVVIQGGALGTPSSGVATNLTGTANGLTAGSATVLANTRTIGGSNFNGSANVTSFPSPGAIGGSTPAAGTFTTLVAGSATSLLLGTAGSAVGSVGFRNATTGTITVSPPTGALGTIAQTLSPNAGAYVNTGDTGTVTNTMLAGSIATTKLASATTVGGNLLALTNPSAISFPKIAADNTVSTRTPAQVLSDIGADNASNLASGNVPDARNTVSNSTTTTLSALTTIGAAGAGTVNIPYTTSSSSAITGSLKVGNGTAATNVGMGGGVITAGAAIVGGGVYATTTGVTGGVNNVAFMNTGSTGRALFGGNQASGTNIVVVESGNFGPFSNLGLTCGSSSFRWSTVYGANADFSGSIIFSTPQALSGAGAINLTTGATDYTSTGAGEALTLANGTVGQIKTITHIVKGTLGTGVLTPTTKSGYTTITFNNAGDSVTLRYCTTAGWCVVGSFGAVIA